MAKGKSALFWEFRGSLGTQKYTTRFDGEIISSMKGKKNPVYKDKDKQEARDLRMAGYGGCGKVTRVIREVAVKGFREGKRIQSAVNRFVKRNVKKLCTAFRDRTTGDIYLEYNFDVMEVAAGSLDRANAEATVDLEQLTVTFTQEAETNPGGLTRDDDMLYACLFSAGLNPGEEGEEMKCLLETLKPRGENGSTVVQIPKKWNKAVFFVYVFASSEDGKYSSPSTRLYPPVSAEEIAIDEAIAAWKDAEQKMVTLRATATLEQLARMRKAKRTVKDVKRKAEEKATKEGKSFFEAKLSALNAATKHLEEAVAV